MSQPLFRAVLTRAAGRTCVTATLVACTLLLLAPARASGVESPHAPVGPGTDHCATCHAPHVAPGTPILATATVSPISRALGASRSLYVLIASERDMRAPVISGAWIDVSAGTTSPVMCWSTDESATTWVDWGLTNAYELGSWGASLPISTSHGAAPSPVATGTAYHYRLRSADALGNQSVSADAVYDTRVMPSQVPSPTSPFDTVWWFSGSAPVTYVWDGVSMPDGHTSAYQVEVYRNGVLWRTSPWVTTTSWNDSVPSGNAGYSWRVRARDSVDTNIVTAFSPLLAFYSSYGGVSAPMGLPAASLAGVVDGPLDRLAQVALAQAASPAALQYSIDTDAVSLSVRRRRSASIEVTCMAAWASGGSGAATPTPGAPGVPASQADLDAASVRDGAYWRTNAAGADRQWNWQIVRFDVPAGPSPAELMVTWYGHGEPTAGYATRLFVWDAVSSAWVAYGSGTGVAADTTMSASVGSVSNSYCLGCHAGQSPSDVTTISSVWVSGSGDVHGPRAGAGAGGSSGGLSGGHQRGETLTCGLCHSPHGSAATDGLAPYVNGVPTDETVRGTCAACHSGGAASWHAGCISCHESYALDPFANHAPYVDLGDGSQCTDCHRHGSKTKWGTKGLVGAPGCSRPGHGTNCHTFSTTF